MPVSIKMAKTQNLSLNPSKISGTCGRLMCCLKYEQNAYEDAARRMPKQDSFVQTPDGPGNVKSVDLLRERVKVALDNAAPNEQPKSYRNCEIQVLRNGKGSRDGIEIPEERPARYVEERIEEETLAAPVSTSFYMSSAARRLEDEETPVREKIGGPESGEKRRRKRHRGKHSGGEQTAKPAEKQPVEKQDKTPKADKPEKAAKQPAKKEKPAKPSAPKQSAPKADKPAAKPAGESQSAAPGSAEQPAAKRRRPHHRGGRRHHKGNHSGEGSGSSGSAE